MEICYRCGAQTQLQGIPICLKCSAEREAERVKREHDREEIRRRAEHAFDLKHQPLALGDELIPRRQPRKLTLPLPLRSAR